MSITESIRVLCEFHARQDSVEPFPLPPRLRAGWPRW